MSNKLRRVAIEYGWAEGAWHAKGMAEELSARGFKVIDDTAEADIIFAHSAGCYRVPEDAKAQLILLVGLPCGSKRHMALGVARKLKEEFRRHRAKGELVWWANKLLHNGWYIITEPQLTVGVLTGHKPRHLPTSDGRRVLVVRPDKDTLTCSDVDRLVDKEYTFVEVEGSHDQCWVEPRPYVDLMG